MVSTVTSVVLLIAAAYVVVVNWASVYLSYRNLRLGIQKHHSMTPLLSQVFVVLAWLIHQPNAMSWFPVHGFLLVALADPSLWSLLWLPVLLIRRALQARNS